jgi:hypothetical protein
MPTPLAQKIAEVVDEALLSPEGSALFRGDIEGEEWKIIVDYEGIGKEHLRVRVARRERTPE